MPLDTIVRIVSEAIPLGLEKVILSGGEPLIYPDLLPLVEHLRRSGVKVTIYTSGSFFRWSGASAVPGDMLEALAYNQCSFNVSLHSNVASIHDKFMDTPSSWQRAIEFIRRASALACTVDIHTVITRLNCDMLSEFGRFLEPFRIGAWRLLRLVPQGRAKLFYDELVLSDSQWETLKEDLDELRSLSLPFQVRLGAHLPVAIKGNSYHCSLDESKLLVEANGFVSVCPALKDSRVKLNAPNVRSESLVQIIGSEWRTTVASLKTAATCDCPAQEFYEAMQRVKAKEERALVYAEEQPTE